MADIKQNTSDNKSKRLFAAAILFALLAGLGTMLYLKVLEHRLKAELTPPPQTMETVVVASKDLSSGSRIDSSTMALRKVPREYVESNTITPEQFNSVKGATINKPLAQGKILNRDFIDLDLPADFSGTIHDGQRAMTIEVNMINGISGLIRPGNHIDLFARLAARSDPAQSGAGGEIVIPVLENVTVLATDRKSARPNVAEFRAIASEKPPQVYNSLTLEVSSKQAALIAVAQSRGVLIAILRNIKDTSGALFTRVATADLFRNTVAMRNASETAAQKTKLTGIHRNARGQLVTGDGVVITDPNVHLNKKGQLITANGTVLSGHGFTVDRNGKIRDATGHLVDTASLTQTKKGTLVDKNGPVATAMSYKKLKNGFLEDTRGDVLTPDGKILSGVTVDKVGNVHAPDGRIIKASNVRVDKDGRVRVIPPAGEKLQVAPDGSVHTVDGKRVTAGDLLTVDKDGVVRTKSGKILKGWKIGKDGTVYNSKGKKMSAGDVLLAEKGMKAGKDGTVIGKDGKVYHARDLVTVDKDGVVRTKGGTVLKGVYMDKDGRLRDKNGKVLTAQDVIEQEAAAIDNKGRMLSGVQASTPQTKGNPGTFPSGELPGEPYEVEYILGGDSSNGTARTIMVHIKDTNELGAQDE